jgi:hypothetical protein
LLWGDDDRRRWRAEGPLLDGWGVYHAMADSRDGTVYAAANHVIYGPTVQRSTAIPACCSGRAMGARAGR